MQNRDQPLVDMCVGKSLAIEYRHQGSGQPSRRSVAASKRKDDEARGSGFGPGSASNPPLPANSGSEED